MEFGYGRHAEPVIRDLSIDIAPGDHLAIVGPSGIGKSSLAGLLAGMLRPTAGEVLLDGMPVTRYPPASLPGLRVLIPQEAYVFAGTLAENILYLRMASVPGPGRARRARRGDGPADRGERGPARRAQGGRRGRRGRQAVQGGTRCRGRSCGPECPGVPAGRI